MNPTRAKPASAQKIARHEKKTRIWPPMDGARIGARPVTRMRSEKNRAASRSSKRSRTTARAITMPAHPPSAWAKRQATRASMERAEAQPAEAST